MSKEQVPTEQDWVLVQGGKPRVEVNGVTFLVIHDYPGGSGAVVPTTAKQLEQTVIIDFKGRRVAFRSALLWGFHGKPCEEQSRKIKGVGYRRVKTRERVDVE